MKIALGQMNVVPGNPKLNLEKMLEMVRTAKSQDVDLIAFPEMCLGGYLVGDKWTEDAFCRDLMECDEVLRNASDGIAIAYGNIYIDSKEDINARLDDSAIHPNKDGRSRKYNAIRIFQNKKPVQRRKKTKALPEGTQPKALLPNYRFFDDERYFFSLEDVAKDAGVPLEDIAQPYLITTKEGAVPIGFETCEDLWCEDYRKDGKSLDMTKLLVENGAEKIVNISASPWTFGKNASRDKRVKFIRQDIGDKFVPFHYVNCVGAQNNGKNIVTFDGGSTVYNKNGDAVVHSSHPYQEELLIIDEEDITATPKPRTDRAHIAEKCDAILQGIRHVKDMLGRTTQPRYVIGMSGGVDSAVVTTLLTLAVGPDNVLGINMPTKYNSEKTKDAAAQVAEKLGIAYQVIPIEDIMSVNGKALEEAVGKKMNSLQEENLQAKIRGASILSNIAPMYGALFTNNGNKLEVALGYATLYGDINGAIAPIADLTKAEVFDLARYLNEKIFCDEIIPKTLLPDKLFRFSAEQIVPSAELKDKQIDPMKFGYHDALLEAMTDYRKKTTEDLMHWYLDGTLHTQLKIPVALMERWGVDNGEAFVEDLEWFSSSIRRNVFKRVQSPPIIITSKSSYGYDIRESIMPDGFTREHERLKEQILSTKKYTPQ